MAKSKVGMWFLVGLMLCCAGLILYQMGRSPICTCGYIKFWHGAVWSSENSQHITDWYTFSHIIHGFLFYWILKRVFPRFSASQLLVLAILIESVWEIFENTDMVIERYRAATISLNYYGDSIINSLSDIVACIIGFEFVRRVPIKVSLVVMILFELWTLWVIRDNLTLNILMLLYPVSAIRTWQSPGL